jgi:outer membrane lipoprotein SlyB
MKEQISTLKNNPIGLVVGAGAGYLVATKLVKTDKMWMKIGIALAGAVAGAMVQAKIKAKKGVPTASTVTKTK